ncbi:MAG: hypothetical protein ACRCYE_06530, partial [Sarcina sp.]
MKTENLIITKENRYLDREEAQLARDNIKTETTNEPLLRVNKILKDKYYLTLTLRDMTDKQANY